MKVAIHFQLPNGLLSLFERMPYGVFQGIALDTWNSGVYSNDCQWTAHPDYDSLVGRAPVLQTNKDVTISQVNQELIDALEEATKVDQENEEICHLKHYAVYVFSRVNPTIYDNFKNHGMESTCPMIDGYKSLFLSHRGDRHQAGGVFMAAHLFNPLTVVGMCSDQLVDTIRDLCPFGFN